MPAKTAPDEETPLCSKCGKNPRANANGTNPWCRECKAAYQAGYEKAREHMTESRGYAAGCSAMRDRLARTFNQWPSAHFSGAEVAAMVMKAADPGSEREIPHQG